MKELFSLIERPLITEKSMIQADRYNKYTFRVRPDANKIQIKQAIEKAFEVDVLKVTTMNVPGKSRRLGRFKPGRTPAWKKAIVTLAEGQTIPGIFEGL